MHDSTILVCVPIIHVSMSTCIIIIIPKFVAICNECMHYEQIYHTPKFAVNSGQGEEHDLCVKTT